ncbi:MAG: S8 family serine peptidase [Candidatus Tectimicrobiota bacterium]
MPRSRRMSPDITPASGPDPARRLPDGSVPPSGEQPGWLITFRPGALETGVHQLRDAAGVSTVAFAAEFAGGAVDLAQLAGSDLLVLNTLGIAVADVAPDQMAAMTALAQEEANILSIEPEPVFFTMSAGLPPATLDYLRGYRDAVDHLYRQFVGAPDETETARPSVTAWQDTEVATWGLQATNVLTSRWSGQGVKVAVLDTGLDLDHPDMQGRVMHSHSFIPGQDVYDDNGHGTHCIGTACGPRQRAGGRGYGIAFESEIFAGKVLSNQGSSLGRSTLAGIEWAITNGCHIISMSLGAPVRRGERFLNAFERLARMALQHNALLIAAAGNESQRQNLALPLAERIAPVASPANCPAIMAVAALDKHLQVASFSNGSINPESRVDIAAPGVDIYSSAPDPAAPRQAPGFRQWSARYDMISGTSMATPHVSGIAALLRQANPHGTATELWQQLIVMAQALPLSARDIGAGLVQAP